MKKDLNEKRIKNGEKENRRTSSDTICNNSRKSASHICAIPQKD